MGKRRDEKKENQLSSVSDREKTQINASDFQAGHDAGTSISQDTMETVKRTFEMGMMSVSQENEIAKKINGEHIASYLDGMQENMRNRYKEKREQKIFNAVMVAVVLIFFTVIIVLLKDTPDVLEKIVWSVSGLVAGAIGGYGAGRLKSNEDE